MEGGYIDFQTYSPGTQWKDLLIYGSTAGDRITIDVYKRQGIRLVRRYLNNVENW